MIHAEAQIRPPSLRPIDLTTLLLIALLLVPAMVALATIPFAHNVLPWVVPVAAASGFAIGIALVSVPLAGRWWWAVLSCVLLFGAAAGVGVVLIGHGRSSGAAASLTALLGMYATALSAAVVWLIYRAGQPWLSLVLAWTTIAGAWGIHLSLQQTWWVILLVVVSFMALGVWYLRQETYVWRALALEQIGPVLWPSARAIVAISVLVALFGLLPLSAFRLAQLRQALHNSPLPATGPLSYDSPNGTPIAVLGAPLNIDAPDVASQRVILSYAVLSNTSPSAAPADATPGAASGSAPGGDSSTLSSPLLGATFDTFDGTTWTQAARTTSVRVPSSLASPPDAHLLRTRITLYAPPANAGTTLLLGFDQPVSFVLANGAAVQVRVLAGQTPAPLSVAAWEVARPLGQGDSYTVTSAVLDDRVAPAGTLPPALVTQMTQVPPAVVSELKTVAQQWVGTATTPVAQMETLIDAMNHHLVLDPKAKAPAGENEITWFLRQHHGNVLLWTTTYILLGRALGLPVRLAEGYLPGSYDPQYKQEVVRASDATIWAQLAIPGKGWLDLLPVARVLTVQVPSKIVYTGQATPTPQPTHDASKSNPPPSRRFVSDQGAQAWGIAIPVIALLLLLIAGALAFFSVRWRRFGAGLAPLTRFFARLGVLAKLAGIALRASDTATQATGKVVAYLPEQQQPLVTLNQLYERARYGPPAERGLLPDLRAQWQRLSGALWRLVVSRAWRPRVRQQAVQAQTKKG